MSSANTRGLLNDSGLLKMDFLGLKTLTVIEDTLALIHQREPEFLLKSIPLNDGDSFAPTTAAKRSASSKWNPEA
jgi:DNA polymerase-3 subunit alpha